MERKANPKYLMQMQIFKNIDEDGIEKIIDNLNCRIRNYQKGDIISRAGDRIQKFGIVMKGSVVIESVDLWGNSTILGIVERGGIFGESYAILASEHTLVSTIANENSEILIIDLGRIKALQKAGMTVTGSIAGDARFIENILTLMAQKSLNLSRRLLNSTPKKIRERVLLYLSQESSRQGSTTIKLPFNRQQMADYLGVERSALSKELGKMRDEDIIEFHKDKFIIRSDAL